MYSVRINEECKTQVTVDFRDVYELILDADSSHLIEYFQEPIDRFSKKTDEKGAIYSDKIDEYEDYYYSITCDTEDEAKDVEKWFEQELECAESIVNDYIEEVDIDYCEDWEVEDAI